MPVSPIAGSQAHDPAPPDVRQQVPGPRMHALSGYAVVSATPQLTPIASSSLLITPPWPLIAISSPTAGKLSSAARTAR